MELISGADNSPDPLVEIRSGRLKYPSLVVIDLAYEAQVLAIKAPHRRILRPQPDTSFASCLRAALGYDPDSVLVWARDLSAQDIEMLSNRFFTGLAILVLGDGDQVEALTAVANKFGVPVVLVK